MFASFKPLFAIALVAIALVAIVASAGLAQEEGKQKKRDAGAPGAVTRVVQQTETLGLNDEQTKKIREVADSYAPKFKAASAKFVLTDTQKKARADTVARNKSDGVKGKAVSDAITATLNLTEEQKKAQIESQESIKELTRKFVDEVTAVLNAEQKAKFKALRPRKLEG